MDVRPAPEAEEMTVGDYVLAGVFMAFAACLLSMFALAVAAATQRGGGPVRFLPMAQLPLGLGLIVAGYFAAGILAALGAWALRSERTGTRGWVLSGVWVAACAYGVVGLAAVLAFVLFDVNLLAFDSARGAWVTLLWTTALFALVAGVPGGLYWRRRSGASGSA